VALPGPYASNSEAFDAEPIRPQAEVHARTDPHHECKPPDLKIVRKEFDLRGKEYFTVAEAAHFCCVSLSQFSAHEPNLKALGFAPLRIMGKKVYRRVDLISFIEESDEWQQSVNAAEAGISTGVTLQVASASRSPLGQLQRGRQRMLASSKRLNSALG